MRCRHKTKPPRFQAKPPADNPGAPPDPLWDNRALRSKHGRLLQPVEFEPASWPVNLVYPGGGMLPLKLRAFLDFAAPRLKLALSDSSGSNRPGR